MPSAPELTEYFFRRESGRMVAALTRVFGVHNLALAEDAVQDAFCRALAVWNLRGVPDNPGAWLTATAKAPRARCRSSDPNRRSVRAGAEPFVRRRAGHGVFVRHRRVVRWDRHRRRAASHDVLLLPSAPQGRGAGPAHSQHSVRIWWRHSGPSMPPNDRIATRFIRPRSVNWSVGAAMLPRRARISVWRWRTHGTTPSAAFWPAASSP